MRKLTLVKKDSAQTTYKTQALLRMHMQNKIIELKRKNTVFMKKQQVNRRIRYPLQK